MNSIVARGYRSIDVKYPRRRYREPFVIIAGIIDHINGHFVRVNRIALNISILISKKI